MTNKGVVMHCKAVTDNLLTVLCLLVEPSTAITKPKGSIEAYLSISQHPIILTSSIPVISTSLSSFLFFRIMLRSNNRSYRSILKKWITVNIYDGNSADLCGRRIRTVKMKRTASRNCLSFIDLIKGRYILFWGTSTVEKVLLKQSMARCSENSLIPTNLT